MKRRSQATAACPACRRATAGRRRLVHEATCALGRAVEQIVAADRRFFEQHPHLTTYQRPVTRAEVAALRAAGLATATGSATGQVCVTQVRPGLRVRSFGDVTVTGGVA